MKRLTNLFSAPVKSLSRAKNTIKKAGGVIGLASIISFASLSNSDAQTVLYDSKTKQIKIIESAEKPSQDFKYILNPYQRPNLFPNQTDYGMIKDINQNKIIDPVDYNYFLNSGEKSDIDLNGVKGTPNDNTILKNSVDERIPLPADWNNLTTRQQRIDYINKTKLIDKTDEYNPVTDVRECGWFALRNTTNHSGFIPENVSLNELSKLLDTTENGKYDIPMYLAYTSVDGKEGKLMDHMINAILVGEEPLNFNDWYFIEPQNDEIVKPGDWSMSERGKVIIAMPRKIREDGNGCKESQLIVWFSPKGDGIYEDVISHPDLVRPRPKEIISAVEEQKPFEYTTINNPNPFNNSTTITYNIEKPSEIVLDIYNSQGQKLETLVNDYQQQGQHNINWSPKGLASGNYYYLIKNKSLPNKIQKGKMMLMK